MAIKITISDMISKNNGWTVLFRLYTDNVWNDPNKIAIHISNNEVINYDEEMMNYYMEEVCPSDITVTSKVYKIAIRKIQLLLLNAANHIELDNVGKEDFYIPPKSRQVTDNTFGE
jgi:hypothetical protein